MMLRLRLVAGAVHSRERHGLIPAHVLTRTAETHVGRAHHGRAVAQAVGAVVGRLVQTAVQTRAMILHASSDSNSLRPRRRTGCTPGKSTALPPGRRRRRSRAQSRPGTPQQASTQKVEGVDGHRVQQLGTHISEHRSVAHLHCEAATHAAGRERKKKENCMGRLSTKTRRARAHRKGRRY